MSENDILSQKMYKLLNKVTENVDTYYYNETMWLIFSDSKQWVIELTREGTLWYNYYFFENVFIFFNLDVVKNQHYITEWVENTIQNGVRSTGGSINHSIASVENTIQNGVRSTKNLCYGNLSDVEDTIKNGVKKTYKHPYRNNIMVEDILQNGVKQDDKIIKETIDENHHRLREVVVTLKYGIKETKQEPSQRTWMVDNVIKETYHDEYHHKGRVDGVIGKGIKETNWRKVNNFPEYENRVIENGKLIKKD
jgi:hypothetical protein